MLISIKFASVLLLRSAIFLAAPSPPYVRPVRPPVDNQSHTPQQLVKRPIGRSVGATTIAAGRLWTG